jgi:transposase-like protein
MAPIDNAIADLELPEEGADFTLTQIADRHGVNRSTLSWRWRGLTGSPSDGYTQQQLLNPQQEDELIRYIEDLILPQKSVVSTLAKPGCHVLCIVTTTL